MRYLLALLFCVGAAGAFASCGGGGSPGPTCRTGCPCGSTCISCSDRCHHAIEAITADDGGADVPED